MTDVDRYISIYEKHSENYIGEISLEKISLSDLLSLIPSRKRKDDYLLYNCYLLDKTILDKIAILDNQSFNLNFDIYEYYLEAFAK